MIQSINIDGVLDERKGLVCADLAEVNPNILIYELHDSVNDRDSDDRGETENDDYMSSLRAITLPSVELHGEWEQYVLTYQVIVLLLTSDKTGVR